MKPQQESTGAAGQATRPPVVLAGDAARPEFRLLPPLLADAELFQVGNMEQAAASERLRETWPAVVVVLQTCPKQFSDEQAARWQRRWPLAAVLAATGPWCEGESRSAVPWAAAERGTWLTWLHRWPPAWAACLAGACPEWGHGAAAQEEERVQRTTSFSPRGGHLVVGVASADTEIAAWLGAECAAAGHASINLGGWRGGESIGGLSALLWDRPGTGQDSELPSVVRAVAPAAVLMLANFPRPEQVVAWRQAGVQGVLAKPLRAADLHAELGRTCGPSSRGS